MPGKDDDVIWMRPEVAGRGRAPAYSREQIADAAVAIADAEGLDAVSMRRVANRIGAGPMSLYRYVRGKDELHQLMVERGSRWVRDNWTGSPGDGWAQTLRGLALATRRCVLRHPWWPQLVAVVDLDGPAGLELLETVLGSLDGLGLDIDQMLEVTSVVRIFALGYAQAESRRLAVLAETGRSEDEVRMRLQPYVMSLIESGDHPYLARVVIDARTPHDTDRDALFERALDRVLAGIAATLPAKLERQPQRGL